MKQVYDLSYLDTTALVYLLVLCVILGLCMGSALNCLAWRIANKKSWTKGKSICPACRHELHTRDLIPLFSYIFSKGKCRYCGEKISPRYPLTELGLAVIFVAVFLRYGFTLYTLDIMVLASCLFTLSLIDLDTMTIPDRFLIIPAVCQLVYAYYYGGFASVWYALWHGLTLGGAVLLISLFMDKVLKKESMGGGDIKLLFVLGLFLDLPECLLLLVFSCVLGLVMALLLRRSEKAFPFGPALSAGMLLTLMVGAPIVNWYLGLF
ncbi:MAG: prepilin peptidase [Firmicutes bacterium]|nr:prepilin peptidase [Bacillota bacterium]